MEVNASRSLYRCVKTGHVVRGTREGVGGYPPFLLSRVVMTHEKSEKDQCSVRCQPCTSMNVNAGEV